MVRWHSCLKKNNRTYRLKTTQTTEWKRKRFKTTEKTVHGKISVTLASGGIDSLVYKRNETLQKITKLLRNNNFKYQICPKFTGVHSQKRWMQSASAEKDLKRRFNQWRTQGIRHKGLNLIIIFSAYIQKIIGNKPERINSCYSQAQINAHWITHSTHSHRTELDSLISCHLSSWLSAYDHSSP